MNVKLGELLVRKNVITSEQLEKALEEQKSSGERLGAVLTKLGLVKENELLTFMSNQYGIPSISLSEFDIDPGVLKLIPSEVVHKYRVVPLNLKGSTLIIAMADPSNIFAIDDIKFLTGYRIEALAASESDIKTAMEKHYDSSPDMAEFMGKMDGETVEFLEEGEELDIGALSRASEDAPVVKLVNYVLTDAIKKKASDIHIEPYEKSFRIRYRMDGVLYEMMKPPMKMKNALISRVKIMSKLDIAERRLPQDGRIKLKLGRGEEMDYRVSVLPTLFGEKVVLRLLDKSTLQLDMTKLGFEEKPLKDFQDAIHKPYGMVLVTGPTGSGKTTTLYSAISELNKTTENISTAEDPVEFNLPGVNQVQIHEEIGLSFANALRSFLRQDPDIILVGEIRDFETAEIAIKAALTGHLVLSTLHTNDAPSTVNRLLNMGVEPFMVASSVNLILAQRLVRKICAACKEPVEISDQALLDLGLDPEECRDASFFHGKGCPKCSNTGFKGRLALYEVMPAVDSLKELVLQGASSLDIKKEAIHQGMKTLRMSGITKFKEGITSIEEVLRATIGDG